MATRLATGLAAKRATGLRRLARRLLHPERPSGTPPPTLPDGPPPPGPPLPTSARRAHPVAAAGRTLTIRRDIDGRLHAVLPDGAVRTTWVPGWDGLSPALADQLATCRLTRWARETAASDVKAEAGAEAVGAAVTASLR
jgi:hypothetical protein